MTARRPWAWPLVPLYAAGLAGKGVCRAVGCASGRRLRWPVVSVGSLSAGGAGKTPVVIALAKMLHDRGWNVDVLSRGYGREQRGIARVDAGVPDAAQRFGDEPVLITSSAGVPVWVGADRFAAGQAAESTDGTLGLHLLDDGFQHRRLLRDMDVVLVTAEELRDALLPAGNLREPIKALRRADVLVVREDERDNVLPQVNTHLKDGASIWSVTRRLETSGLPPDLTALAFCGIARPQGFWSMLEDTGCRIAAKVAFGDHYRYGMADMDHLIGMASKHNARSFITTEKDAVKLTAQMRARLEAAAPLYVSRLQVSFTETERVLADLETRLT